MKDKSIEKFRVEFRRHIKSSGIKYTPWAIKNKISPAVVSRFYRGGGISTKNLFRLAHKTGISLGSPKSEDNDQCICQDGFQ